MIINDYNEWKSYGFYFHKLFHKVHKFCFNAIIFPSINLPLVIFQAFGKNGLSPGYFNMKFSSKMDYNRVKKREKTSLPETKRRRLILKQERANQKNASEVSEGSTYQSGW